MLLQSSPGLVPGSLRWSTIGSEGLLLNIIVLRSSFLVGLSTGREPAGNLRLQTNFLEPLQNPPGPQEGRLREPSLQALLRELAAFNTGLCVITTRLPVADIADYERTSAPRHDLEQLSTEAGAKLLRALGVKGDE